MVLHPVFLLLSFVQYGSSPSFEDIGTAFFGYIVLFAFSPLLLAAYLICWGLPALVATSIALWFRSGVLGFILTGAIIGTMGLAIFQGVVLPIYSGMQLMLISAAITGSISATVAWWYMWMGHQEPKQVSLEPKDSV